MALIKCQHCGKDVFKMAYSCPGCGGWTRWGYVGILTFSAEAALVAMAAVKYLVFA